MPEPFKSPLPRTVRLDRLLRIPCDLWNPSLESISVLVNATGPSGPHPYLWGDPAGLSASAEYGNPSLCSEMRLDLLGLHCLIWRVPAGRSASLECKLGGVSGPSEPHLPDTARLRRPLRTTQETGLNHFSPGWTKKCLVHLTGGYPSHPKILD